MNLLPALLLPLAGPEDLDDEETEALPIDLQYLPPEKTREPDADIRNMLLEAMLQLCATRISRETLRKKKIYPILRELHKWETEDDVKSTCQRLVEIIIRDEDMRFDNFKEIEIPESALKTIADVASTEFDDGEEEATPPATLPAITQ